MKRIILVCALLGIALTQQLYSYDHGWGRQYKDGRKLWSVGCNVGTSFATPLLIGNLAVTLAPFPYFFLEMGCDIGIIHGFPQEIKDVSYYSIYPYGHINGLVPITPDYEDNMEGWYFGIGGGYMLGTYTYPEETKIDPVKVNTLAFDLTTGAFIGSGHHLFRFGYILRTDFYGINHKLMVGYAYRF
jgi:hypothetical protein